MECLQRSAFVGLVKANDALVEGAARMKVYIVLQTYSSDEGFVSQIQVVRSDKERAEQTCRELNAEITNNPSHENRGMWYEVEPWEVIE